MLEHFLNVELCQVSCQHVKKGWEITPHRHAMWQYLQVESGSILCTVLQEHKILQVTRLRARKEEENTSQHQEIERQLKHV